MDEREYSQMIADIREWLVKIDANQAHQTQMLEAINQQATNAFTKADSAEDKADEAYKLAKDTETKLDKYIEDERSGRRWLTGVVVAAVIALLPVFNSFYL